MPRISPRSFTDIPTELLLEIISYLQRPNINALLRVSNWLATIMTPVLGRFGAVDCSLSRRSLLHWAAANGRTALLRLVLRHGVDVHQWLHRVTLWSAMPSTSHTIDLALERGRGGERERGWLDAVASCYHYGVPRDSGSPPGPWSRQ